MRKSITRRLALSALLFSASSALAMEDLATRDRLWTRQLAGASDMRVAGIVRDAADDLLIAGEFSGTIDLDPGPDS
ncbi:MAG TPA: hypothetical protein VMQ62_08435, partial [Dongiaceae bacterium]|nr:hypothetical protein [Dongiaceae bacterium]